MVKFFCNIQLSDRYTSLKTALSSVNKHRFLLSLHSYISQLDMISSHCVRKIAFATTPLPQLAKEPG